MAGKDKKKQKKISEFATPAGKSDRMAEMAERGERSESLPQNRRDGGQMETPHQVDLATILNEIQLFRTEISTKTDKIDSKMDLFQTKFGEIETRITTLEDRIAALEDRVAPIEAAGGDYSTRIKWLETAVDGQENRGRRNNVRIVGLPEGCEKGHPTDFFEQLLRQLLPNAKFTNYYSVVRAHRTLGPRPPPGALPRVVLVRFLHYRDRDMVLAAAREAGAIKYENVTLSIYQDLSTAVQRERKKFETAKKLLREKGYKYSMLFPARLRIEANGKAHFFTNPKDDCVFVERQSSERRSRTNTNRMAESNEN